MTLFPARLFRSLLTHYSRNIANVLVTVRGWEDKFADVVDHREANLLHYIEENQWDADIADLSPADIDPRPCLRMVQRSRYEWGDFEALSYTWGDRKPCAKIILNGRTVYVPKNLAAALLMLRDLPETALGMHYWVDALCINQEDVAERNHQVKRMKNIFSRARSVVVWLGEESQSDGEAFKVMCQLNYGQLWVEGAAHAKCWSVLAQFMDRPYWKRLWIIQELAVNWHSTLFVCGRSALCRPMIESSMTYCILNAAKMEHECRHAGIELRPGKQRPFLWHRAYQISGLLRSKPEYANLQEALDNTLYLARTGEAEDPKDKIYGLLGLMHADISSRVEPNYHLSKLAAYTNFAMTLLAATGSLEVLFCWTNNAIPERWPSWIPDWSTVHTRNHMQWLRRRQADAGHIGNLPTFTILEDCYLLCRGYTIGKVDAVGQPLPEYLPSRSAIDPITTSPTTEDARLYNDSEIETSLVLDDLERTLRMDHPHGVDQKPILSLVWGSFHSDAMSTPAYDTLQTFLYVNKDFKIGGRHLKDFFPLSGSKRVARWEVHSLEHTGGLTAVSLAGRKLITTDTEYLGLAPESAEVGDVVAVIVGCSFPVILRPYGRSFKVVGEAYIDGMMDGEVLGLVGKGKCRQRVFGIC